MSYAAQRQPQLKLTVEKCNMNLWLLMMAVTVSVGTAVRLHDLSQRVTDLKKFVSESIWMGDNYLILNRSPYSIARVLQNLNRIAVELGDCSAKLAKRCDDLCLNEVGESLLDKEALVKCYNAEIYLMPPSFMSTRMDWSKQLKCLKHYTVKAVTDDNGTTYALDLQNKGYESANEFLRSLFATAQKKYKDSNTDCDNIFASAQPIYKTDGLENTANEYLFVVEQIYFKIFNNVEAVTTQKSYKADLYLFRKRINMFHKSQPFATLLSEIKLASAVAEVSFDAGQCRTILTQPDIVERKIAGIQLDLMVFRPFGVAEIEIRNKFVLYQFLHGYLSAFNKQIKSLFGEMKTSIVRPYKAYLEELQKIFVENRNMNEYVTGLNKIGEDIMNSQMPQRFVAKKYVPNFCDVNGEKKVKQYDILVEEYLRRSMLPNVSFLPVLAGRRNDPYIIRSRHDLNECVEKHIKAFWKVMNKWTNCADFANQLAFAVNKAKIEIAERATYRVYYYKTHSSDSFGIPTGTTFNEGFYRARFVKALATLKAKDGNIPLRMKLDDKQSDALGFVIGAIENYANDNEMTLNKFRGFQMLIQFIDEHSEPFCAEVKEETIDGYTMRIKENVNYVLHTYYGMLLDQIDAATYLDDEKRVELSNAVLNLQQNINDVKLVELFKLNKRLPRWMEDQCRHLIVATLQQEQLKAEIHFASYFFTPTMFNGIVPVLEYAEVSFTDADDTNTIMERVGWKYMRDLIKFLVENSQKLLGVLEFLPREYDRFQLSAVQMIDGLERNFPAVIKNVFHFHMQFETTMTMFYTQFELMLRPMRNQKEFIRRCYRQFITVDWYLNHKNDDFNIPKLIDAYVAPLHDRLTAHFDALKASCTNLRRDEKEPILKEVRSQESIINKTRDLDFDWPPNNPNLDFTELISGEERTNYKKYRDDTWLAVHLYLKERIEPLYNILNAELKLVFI